MYNCKLQEAVITVNPTSRNGLPYDIAHVETIIITDSPIPPEEIFLVPGSELIPQNILQILQLGNKVDFTPIPKSEVTANLSDFTQHIDQQQKDAVLADAMLGLATVWMKPIQFKPTGNNNFYRLSYDYTLFPSQNGSFYIYTKLPFKGFQMPVGGQVRFTAILPFGAKHDPNETKGIALNNQLVEEQAVTLANNGEVISFYWKNDPDFTVKYNY